MINPIDVVTQGYLNSPLSVVSDGYIDIPLISPLGGGSGNKGSWFAMLRAEDDEIIALMATFLEIVE